MNKIGRNKAKWLEKQGCVFKNVDWDNEAYTEVYTSENEYVGLADLGNKATTINFIYKNRLTNLMSVNRALGLPLSTTGCNAVSVGFNEKEQSWYGWTHRGWGKFFIGYEIVKDSIMDRGEFSFPFKVKTLEEAKILAARLANYLS